VISAIFASPELLADAQEKLDGQDFGVPAHVPVFDALSAADAWGRGLDAVTITDELTRSGELAAIRGVATLDTLIGPPPAVEPFTPKDSSASPARSLASRWPGQGPMPRAPWSECRSPTPCPSSRPLKQHQ
jgi:hypothetical protein